MTNIKNDLYMILDKNNIKRITCVTGHFGSGKTEFSLNYALKLKDAGLKVTIIDFDIVNPYFRTKDVQDYLKSLGIKVISPEFANLNIENPCLPPEVYSAFDDKSSYVIFDVGGDEDGATPLGFYHNYFVKEDYDMFFVLNERRLLTQSVEDTKAIFDEIAYASRLKPTAVVSNAHLMQFTDAEVIARGACLAENFACAVGLPLKYVAVDKRKEEEFKNSFEIPDKYKSCMFPMELFVGPGFNRQII